MNTNRETPADSIEKEEGKTKIGWAVWVLWVLANAVGWIVGMSFLWSLGFIIEPFFKGISKIIGWGVAGSAVGLVFGINEWFIFRPLGNQPLGKWTNWWVIATIGGWSTSMMIIVGFGAGESLGFAVTGAVIGITVGIAQWLILRPQFRRAELWGFANAAGWILGLGVIDLIDQAVGFSVAGLISGTITGTVLIWLLQNPRKPTYTQHSIQEGS